MRSLHYICGFQLLHEHKRPGAGIDTCVCDSLSFFFQRALDLQSPPAQKLCSPFTLPRWRLKSSAEGDTELFFFFFAERKPWQPALAAISRRKRSRHLLLDASLSADTAAVTPAQSCHLGTVQAVHERHICQMFGVPILKTGLLYYAAGYIQGEMHFFLLLRSWKVFPTPV